MHGRPPRDAADYPENKRYGRTIATHIGRSSATSAVCCCSGCAAAGPIQSAYARRAPHLGLSKRVFFSQPFTPSFKRTTGFCGLEPRTASSVSTEYTSASSNGGAAPCCTARWCALCLKTMRVPYGSRRSATGSPVFSPDGSFSRVSGLPSNNVFCLDHGPEKTVFACTDKGLVEVAPGHLTIVDGHPLRATCDTQPGTRWIADLDGQMAPLGGPALPGISGVTTLACEGDAVWAGTSDGVVRIRHSRIDTRLDAGAGLPDNAAGALAISSDRSVWIGSDDGISRWRDGELSVYRTRDGLSHSVVLALYVDKEGTLWTGTKDGLDQFTDPKLTPYSRSDGLSSNEVGPVLQDRNGLLWIGTLDKGLDVFDGRRFRHISTREGLLSNQVVALAEDKRGNIWAGTARGVNQIRAGRILKRLGSPGTPSPRRMIPRPFGSPPPTESMYSKKAGCGVKARYPCAP